MLLQAALNGPFLKDRHPALPMSVQELCRDAVECVVAGARAIHLHPRDDDGKESLSPEVVEAVVSAVRARCRVPVGISTGAWIEPDLERRLAQVNAWRTPDYASVNVSEPGADQVMRAVLDAGVGIEAGVWTIEDAERLAASGLADRVMRVLVEPVDVRAGDAVHTVDGIHAALDRAQVAAPRLQHGDGDATWILVEDAIRRGLDTRVGFEDTTFDPDGKTAAANAVLVRAAHDLGAGYGRSR